MPAAYLHLEVGHRISSLPDGPLLTDMNIGFRIFCKVVWQTFENEFQDTLESVARHTNKLQEEISLAHRKTVQVGLDSQGKFQASTSETLRRIEVSNLGHNAH